MDASLTGETRQCDRNSSRDLIASIAFAGFSGGISAHRWAVRHHRARKYLIGDPKLEVCSEGGGSLGLAARHKPELELLNFNWPYREHIRALYMEWTFAHISAESALQISQ